MHKMSMDSAKNVQKIFVKCILDLIMQKIMHKELACGNAGFIMEFIYINLDGSAQCLYDKNRRFVKKYDIQEGNGN